MRLKLGNTVTLQFPVKDSTGNLIINLNTAVAVKFLIKINPTDTDLEAIISKTLGSGITVDDPSLGYIKVEIESNDFLNVSAGDYYFGLQVEFPSSKIYELDVIDNDCPSNLVSIVQDVVE